MRLLRIATVYPEYARQFYAQRPGLAGQPFARQEAALSHDAFGWGNAWSGALAPLGYEVGEIALNLEPLQRAWAREQGLANAGRMSLGEILWEQVQRFRPEVVWYEFSDRGLLQRIRTEMSSVRLVLGWCGSALHTHDAWGQMECVLSCAPETVATLRAQGLRAEHLDHAFDPRINARLEKSGRPIALSFIGSIVRRSQFHLERERLLEQLVQRGGPTPTPPGVEGGWAGAPIGAGPAPGRSAPTGAEGPLPVEIFSPNSEVTWRHYAKAAACGGAYGLVRGLQGMRLLAAAQRRSSLVRTAARIASAPGLPVSPRLRRHLRPGVYGLAMYQVLHDSAVTLNIHADSSPEYASNSKLFEGTGVGTCLLTDWRRNIGELFAPEREVVTYRTPAECVEKARWLLEHPRERREIARAGQARVLREHTFAHRAGRLDAIIRGALE